MKGLLCLKKAASIIPRDKGLRDFIVRRRINRNWQLYVMLIPVAAFFVVFCYMPMCGIVLAFKDYRAMRGIMGSPWAEPLTKYFVQFFNSPYFERVVGNTILLSLESLIFNFPLPILLALSINEVRSVKYKKIRSKHHLCAAFPVGIGAGGRDPRVLQHRLRHCQYHHPQARRRGIQLAAARGHVPAALYRLEYLAEHRLGFHHLHRRAGGNRSAAARGGHDGWRQPAAAHLAHQPAGYPADDGHPADPEFRPDHERRL